MPTPAVLITGASTGIGRACALDLLSRNYLVIAGIRRDSDAQSLRAAAGPAADHLHTITLDVTRPPDIHALSAFLTAHLPDHALFALINNAGIGVGGPLEFLSPDDLRRQLEVNVIGTHAVTQAALPFLRAAASASPPNPARGARIVNISSISGRVSFPFLGPYCASKHALEALSDALRIELSGTGIRITIIQPGAIATPIWSKARTSASSMWDALPPAARERYGPMLDNFDARIAASAAHAIDASHVARAVAHALASRRPPIRRLVGRDAKLGALMARWLPTRLFDALIARDLHATARAAPPTTQR